MFYLYNGGEVFMEFFSLRKRIWWSVSILVFLFVMFFFVFQFFYAFYHVVGTSMEPALIDGEIYLVNKKPSSIQRGDIVVFHSSKQELDFIKRVVALPGEEIEIRNGRVYINGALLSESYVNSFPEIADVEPMKVPLDHYYVLGDERLKSFDSRQLGPISRSDIIGILEP